VAHYGCGQTVTHIFNKQIGVNMNQPAFPCQYEEHLPTWNGMTLRDYFAAKAMQAIITNHKLEDCDDFVIAANAYQLADFMLKARGE
jgi:hypothetical protein